MARPGDPYETAELDGLRSRHCRRVRGLDSAVLQGIIGDLGGVAEAVPEAERPQLEVALRELADRELVHLEDLLLRSGRATGDALVSRFLHREGDNVKGAAFEQLADEIGAGARRIGTDTVPRRELVALTRFVYLTLWADQLAGDYTDPRLRT